jgi:hypothetical protein
MRRLLRVEVQLSVVFVLEWVPVFLQLRQSWHPHSILQTLEARSAVP